MKRHPRGHRFICSALIGVLAMLLFSWLPAAAGDGDGQTLSRTEQQLIHEAQQAMAAQQYATAQKQLAGYIDQGGGKGHYLVEFSLGNAWMLDGHPDRALPYYRAAIEKHGTDVAVWQNLGKAYYELARFGEAGDCLAKCDALTRPPSSPLAYQAAVAYIQAKRPADARPLLERIVADTGGNPDPAWLEALLKVYLDLSQKDKAVGLARRMIRRQGQNPRLWQVLTHLYIDCKAYDKAAAAMEIKASLAEASHKEIEQLGDLYRMAGVPFKAARQYEKLLTQTARPKDVEKVASAYLAARRVDTAIDVLERGINRHASPRLWWLLAGAHYEREDFDKALGAFEQCVHNDFRHGKAYLMVGYCALRLDRLAVAQTAFTQAARFPRQCAEAEQRLKELGQHRLSISMRGSSP
ncbi:hypothetical protein DSCO28_60270 [Desulfosarcina ovata subsp. sediminis]|uniref:Tetratricopeptide repeat protein n=1 Tax=Desulfosarcina ovata subsp. sediminis TaxID=885957 RepID=A0A5K7ZZ95_9BACT|nr:tetratricopeptide repeat protein [Desulfosarcina ovata]BBO85461.1 hypothetical protein DSCO28_60270 [Desulfosarcina ovata subsp. sediminis]